MRNKYFACNKIGHFVKMCRFKVQSKLSYNQQKKLPLKHRNNTSNVHLVTDDGQNVGTTDWETANQVFEGIAWKDSIVIFSDSDTCNVSYGSKNVNLDNIQKTEKSGIHIC